MNRMNSFCKSRLWGSRCILCLLLLVILSMCAACAASMEETASGQENDSQGISMEIDQEAFGKLIGEYQVLENDVEGDDFVGSWWHLSIRESEEEGPYLSIYDNAAGNPGIQGKVVGIDDHSIVMEYDEDYYEELPSAHWAVNGKYLELTYEKTEEGISLSCNEFALVFQADTADEE